MWINKFGINVDEGIALSTPAAFDNLYIETDADVNNRFLNWLNNNDKPVLLGGQIGCGKTTFINSSFYKNNITPDLLFHFDTASLNSSLIDSWAIVFAELFRYISIHQLITLEAIPSEIKTVLGKNSDEWLASISKIRMENFSADSIETNRAFNAQLKKIQSFLPKLFDSLILRLEENKQAPLFIFASGVDKFEPGSAAWFSLSEILQSLCQYKTLYEMNAVHLFLRERWMQNVEKIFIPACQCDWIVKMLEKRLGAYVSGYKQNIARIASVSGGIPRQALRLLDALLAEKRSKKTDPEAFAQAIKNINRDFFAFAIRPDALLLQTVAKDNFIETSLISLPGDKETAQNAVFGNWIILYSPENESQWKASINPIISNNSTIFLLDEPEVHLHKEFARQLGTSATGLDGNVGIPGWQNTLIDNIETGIALNITDILELISSALLSKQRADRVIIAYEDNEIAAVVRAYFMAKSNAYEEQLWQHTALPYRHDSSILLQILKLCNQQNIDIFSFEFNDNFPDEQLVELNLKRDTFLNKQMIWWIPKAKLNDYLSRWIQLRQLFQVYILEEELQRSLSIKDIEADIEFMNELAEEGTHLYSYVENLQIVLEYLRAVKGG